MIDDYPVVSSISEEMSRNIIHRISAAKSADEDQPSAIELDSHADAPVVGSSATILERTGRKVSVSGFTDRLGKPLDVEVVHACVVYECDITGKIFILVIRNALHVPDMRECLIHPIMMRLIGIEVDECPKFLSKRPTIENHSIYFPKHDLRIPLYLDGVISYVPIRTPKSNELIDNDGTLDLTPDIDRWDPRSLELGEQEHAMVGFSGEIKADPKRFIISAVSSRSLDPELFCEDLEERLGISSVKFRNENESMDPTILAAKWNISEKEARRTIAVTTRLCPRNTTSITLNRRYPNNDRMLRYRHLPVVMFGDTMFSSKQVGKSIRNFTCAQVFATDFGWCDVYLMEFEREMPLAFKSLFKDVCVPEKMVLDGARAQVKGETSDICRLSGCKVVELERDTPSANHAERIIGELKSDTKSDTIKANSPLVLWCYCLQRRARINSSMARNNFQLDGMTPHSFLTGEITDISNICNFGWYEWVKYRKLGPDANYPLPSEMLGRCLGPCRNKGNEMSQSVLTEDGNVLPIQTLRSLTAAEIDNEGERKWREAFDEKIKKLYGTSKAPPENWNKQRRKHDYDQLVDDLMWESKISENNGTESLNSEFVYEDETGRENEIPEAEEIPDLDLLIGAEVILPQNGVNMQAGKVVGRVLSKDGLAIGSYNKNPVLDTRVYEVMFPDRNTQQYSANLIAEAIYMDCDEDGRRSQVMDKIISYEKSPDALTKEEAWVSSDSNNGQRKHVKTTKGWSFQIRWKDGSKQWIPLKDLKESYPVDLAHFVKEKGIEKEAAFRWWLPYVLRKSNTIVSAVKARVVKKTHKFGIEVPATVIDALKLDKENGDTKWRDAISKEMRNVRTAFRILEEEEGLTVGYSKTMTVHLVFDVKMDLTRKARLVADGHKARDPVGSTYAGVVSRETVRIALTYTALMGLSVLGADIQNAYISAPTTEKFWILCGEEFGSEDKGKRAIVCRALYGMKSAGRDFRNHLRDCMAHLGFAFSRGDADL